MQPTPEAVKKPVSVLTHTRCGPWQRLVHLRWTLDDHHVVSEVRARCRSTAG